MVLVGFKHGDARGSHWVLLHKQRNVPHPRRAATDSLPLLVWAVVGVVRS